MVLLAERTATRLTNSKLRGEIKMSEWEQDASVLRASHPQHILFLCVANSARSQIAEGIARALAPASVRISSAGSRPSHVRTEAIAALLEIGIDIRAHRSKGLAEIDADSVDAVITLCAEEVCPIFPRPILKLHWGLPDPASGSGTDELRLQAFRDVRDELMQRLRQVF
jgi:protein-tyrosine-phosphatase